MPTIDEYEERFQERVEEMYVLAKRMDERADDLKGAAIQGYAENQETVQKLVVPLTEEIREARTVLADLNGASTAVKGYVNTLATHIDRRNLISLILMGVCGLVIVGTIFWVKHANSLVSEANLEVAQANATLGHKPIFLPAATGLGGDEDYDYVRIMPDTQTTLKHKSGKEYPGVYAQVWHK